jgi:hypothetical protein
MEQFIHGIKRIGWLPVLAALFYIVCMTPLMGRKKGYTVDATPSYQLTKTIMETGIWFPEDLEIKQGYIYSITYIPFYALGDALSAMMPDRNAEWIHRKCLCWMNTVITGLTIFLLSMVIHLLGYSKKARIMVPLIYGFSTLAFNYARYDYNKCLAAFLLLLSFYFALRFIYENALFHAMASGTALALLAALRLELAVIVPLLLWIFYSIEGTSVDRSKRVAAFLAPVLIGIAWVLLYNWFYWQSDIAGGYKGEGFQKNPFPGLIGFLFSSGKNIWLFNPVFLILPFALRHFHTRHKDLFILWCGFILLPFVLYCFWGNWWGGWGWGPRHLVPLIPLLVIPLSEVIDGEFRSIKVILGLLFACGCIVQLLGGVIDFCDVIHTLEGKGVEEPFLVWTPAWNPIIWHFNFFRYLPLDRWDYGWIGIKNYLPFVQFLGMLCLWFGSLVLLGYTMIRNLIKSD